MSSLITFAPHMAIDMADPLSRSRMHAVVDALFDALSPDAPTQSADPSAAGSGAKGERAALDADQLRGVLTAFATGAEGAPLNEGERHMLEAIATRSPEPLSYEENRSMLGSGAKFGNVSSGLKRRFWSRGYELPFGPDAENIGYTMTPDVADIVLEVLTETDN